MPPSLNREAEPALYSDLGSLRCWVYSEPSAARQGGKIVSIFASPGESTAPLVQLVGDGDPPLFAPFGVSPPASGAISDRCNLELSVCHPPLKRFLAGLDEHFQEVASEKCSAWFQKQLQKSDVASLQRPLLSPPSSKHPYDLLRVKVPPSARVWQVTTEEGGNGGPPSSWIYKRAASLDAVSRGSRCWITVSVGSLYFLPRLFGCTLTAKDILVFPEMVESPSPFPFVTTVRVTEHKAEEGQGGSESAQDALAIAAGAPDR